jgi:hypothetical protein
VDCKHELVFDVCVFNLILLLLDNFHPTGQQVSMDDVKDEMTEVLKRRNISSWEFKTCTKKYAFGVVDVPNVAEYLVIEYTYSRMSMHVWDIIYILIYLFILYE